MNLPRLIPDEQGRTELNPARFNALRNACAMARFVEECRSITPPASPDALPTVDAVRKQAYIKAMEKTGSVQEAAKLLGVSRGTVYNRLQQMRVSPRQFAKNVIRLAACVAVLAMVGCAGGNVEGRRMNDEVRATRPELPPLPMLSATRRAANFNSVDSALAVAPPAPRQVIFKWTGSTNGWVHVVGRKETLTSPWQEFARVTNRTECPVPPGFYTVLRVEDTDLPGHMWVGR